MCLKWRQSGLLYSDLCAKWISHSAPVGDSTFIQIQDIWTQILSASPCVCSIISQYKTVSMVNHGPTFEGL